METIPMPTETDSETTSLAMSRLFTCTSPADVSGILAASDAASGGSTCEINSNICLVKIHLLSKPSTSNQNHIN